MVMRHPGGSCKACKSLHASTKVKLPPKTALPGFARRPDKAAAKHGFVSVVHRPRRPLDRLTWTALAKNKSVAQGRYRTSPVGTAESSPERQSWVYIPTETSPVGTAENIPGRQSWANLGCTRMLRGNLSKPACFSLKPMSFYVINGLAPHHTRPVR